MRKFNNHKVSKRRRHSFLIQQTSIKDSIGRMSGNGNPLSFIQSHRRFLCVHVVNSKILFLAVFETGLVCNESGGFVFGLPVGVQRFRASLNSEAYSCRHCVYRFCVVWIPAGSPERKLFEKIEPGIPALLRYQRYLTRIPVVWYSRSKREDWFLSDKTPLYLYRKEKKARQLAYGIMAMTSLLSAERLCQTWI